MKNILRIVGAILLIQSVHSCKKKEKPTRTTAEVGNITGTSATSGPLITDEGSGTVIARGICRSTVIAK
jgi:hypothetical protein